MFHKLARGLEVAAADSAERTKRAFGQLREEGQHSKSPEAPLWRNGDKFGVKQSDSPACKTGRTTKKVIFSAESTLQLLSAKKMENMQSKTSSNNASIQRQKVEWQYP